MKLLINIAAHDGILSHYTGVGTMVRRYIRTIKEISDFEITLNLITPEYGENSFGYRADVAQQSEIATESLGGKVFEVSNGSSGDVNYGSVSNWEVLSRNTAELLNSLDYEKYDYVINLFNDTPFAGVTSELNQAEKIRSFWIPHSTVLIHEVDSAIEGSDDYMQYRFAWEKEAIDSINDALNCYAAGIGEYITNHLQLEYGLDSQKCKKLFNGVTENDRPIIRKELLREIDKIGLNPELPIIFSFGRAEPYKNLDYTIKLGQHINKYGFQTLVIAQTYGKENQYTVELQKLSEDCNDIKVLVDPDFRLAKNIYAVPNTIITVVPSKAEVMGLIVNEARLAGKKGSLVVANDIPGINEQINNGRDGLLVKCNDMQLSETAKAINLAYKSGATEKYYDEGLRTINKKYNIFNNFLRFIDEVVNE